MKIPKLLVALTLSLLGSWASAAVEVRFVNPEKFIDIDDTSYRQRDDVLKGIQTHLRTLGEQRLSGKDLLIEVTDVDMAGRILPRGPRMEPMRVLSNSSIPSISLRYVLSEGGKELRHGEARLVDMDYLNGVNRYSDGDPLRYEKRMMDRWFGSEFGPADPKLSQK